MKMTLLKIFEKAWIAAIAVATGMTVINLIQFRTFDHRVYFPAIIAVLCTIVLFNIRSQRKFMEKRAADAQSHK